MGTHRLFKKRPNLEFDKKTEEQRHYENIISFLTDIIEMRRIVYISSINMGKSTEIGSPLQFSIQGIAFYKP